MILSLAPMEGVTDGTFRRVHVACFGALDYYYTPFVAPPRAGSTFGGRGCVLRGAPCGGALVPGGDRRWPRGLLCVGARGAFVTAFAYASARTRAW